MNSNYFDILRDVMDRIEIKWSMSGWIVHLDGEQISIPLPIRKAEQLKTDMAIGIAFPMSR